MHDFLRIESKAISNIVETILPLRLEDFLKGSSVPIDAFMHASEEVARIRINLTGITAKCDGLSKMRFDSRRTVLFHVLKKATTDYYFPEIRSLDETGNSYVTSISRNLDSHPLLPTFTV